MNEGKESWKLSMFYSRRKVASGNRPVGFVRAGNAVFKILLEQTFLLGYLLLSFDLPQSCVSNIIHVTNV